LLINQLNSVPESVPVGFGRYSVVYVCSLS